MVIEPIDADTRVVIDETLASVDNCRRSVRSVFPNVALAVGGVPMGENIEDVSVIQFWKAIHSYSVHHSFIRVVMFSAFSHHLELFTNEVRWHGWWVPLVGMWSGRHVWVEQGECLGFACGQRIDDLNDVTSTNAMNVTLLSSAKWAWTMLGEREWDGDIPIFRSVNQNTWLAIRCRSEYPIRWHVRGYIMSEEYLLSYGPTTLVLPPVTNANGSKTLFEIYVRLIGNIRDQVEGLPGRVQRASLLLTCMKAFDDDPSCVENQSLILLDEDGGMYDGNNFFNGTFSKGQTSEVHYLNEIPCPVSTIVGDISLRRQTNPSDDYTFKAYKGFTLKEPKTGDYECIFQGNGDEVSKTFTKTVEMPQQEYERKNACRTYDLGC